MSALTVARTARVEQEAARRAAITALVDQAPEFSPQQRDALGVLWRRQPAVEQQTAGRAS